MALCEAPSWECPENQFGISPGLSGITQGGLAVTACFRGLEQYTLAKLPMTKEEEGATTPILNSPVAKVIF